MTMTLEKEKKNSVYFSKFCNGHNKTYYYCYPLMNIPDDLCKLAREIGKVNLYIKDGQCPYDKFDEDMIIYAIKYNYSVEEEKINLFRYSLKNFSRCIYYYTIDDGIDCFVIKLVPKNVPVYLEYKKSNYSKMDKLVEINGKDYIYGNFFDVVSHVEHKDNYSHTVYHTIKKSDYGKAVFKEWLKSINSNVDVGLLELDSKLNEKEEILRHG